MPAVKSSDIIIFKWTLFKTINKNKLLQILFQMIKKLPHKYIVLMRAEILNEYAEIMYSHHKLFMGSTVQKGLLNKPSTCVYVGMVRLILYVFLDMTNLSRYCLLKRWVPGCKYLTLSSDSLQLYGHKTSISGADISMSQ